MRRTRVVRIGDVVREFFDRPYVARKIAEASLPEVWSAVAGPAAASMTSRVEYRHGIMYVYVTSSVLRHELFMNRSALRDRINAASKVHDLVRELIIK